MWSLLLVTLLHTAWTHTTTNDKRLGYNVPGHNQYCSQQAKSFTNLTGADYYIGGLLPATFLREGRPIQNHLQILTATTMAYTIDLINNDPNLLPGITLGYDIRDTRNDVVCASEQVLSLLLDRSQKQRPKLIGVSDGSSTLITGLTSPILLMDGVPVVSYFAPGSGLSRKNIYPNFMRTIPSDKHLANAILDFIVHHNWSFVTLLSSNDEIGRFGRFEIQSNMKLHKTVCLQNDFTFTSNLTHEGAQKFTQEHIRSGDIVVLWSSADDATKILVAADAVGLREVTFIGTTEWARKKDFVTVISGRNYSHNVFVPANRNYEKLAKETVKRPEFGLASVKNPWFRDFAWGMGFNPDVQSNQFVIFHFLLPRKYLTQAEATVRAMAGGLHRYLNCTQYRCDNSADKLDYAALYDENLKVKLEIPGIEESFQFSKDGEMLVQAYKYIQIKHGYQYIVGTWTHNSSENMISWQDENIKWFNPDSLPTARCKGCVPGFFRRKDDGHCCWQCLRCTKNSYTAHNNSRRCYACPRDHVVNSRQTGCIPLHEVRLRVSSLEGVLLTIVMLIGGLCTAFVLAVFITYWQTPLVKATNREMSFVQLVFIMLLFCLPILWFLPAARETCLARVFAFGFFFTAIVAFVFVKTWRLYKVFSNEFNLTMSRFLHNEFQIFLSFLIVLLQCSVLVISFVMTNDVRTTADDGVWKDVRIEQRIFYLVCRQEEFAFWFTLAYIFLLVLMSGVMAFRARKIPEQFNEAQNIAYTMFTLTVVWLTYLPLHFSLDPHNQQLAFLAINSISCFTMLFVLYARKVVIILFRPAKNDKKRFDKKAREAMLRAYEKDVRQSRARLMHRFSERRMSFHGFDADQSPTIRQMSLKRARSFTSNTDLDTFQDGIPSTLTQLRQRYLMKKSVSTSFLAMQENVAEKQRQRTVAYTKSNLTVSLTHFDVAHSEAPSLYEYDIDLEANHIPLKDDIPSDIKLPYNTDVKPDSLSVSVAMPVRRTLSPMVKSASMSFLSEFLPTSDDASDRPRRTWTDSESSLKKPAKRANKGNKLRQLKNENNKRDKFSLFAGNKHRQNGSTNSNKSAELKTKVLNTTGLSNSYKVLNRMLSHSQTDVSLEESENLLIEDTPC